MTLFAACGGSSTTPTPAPPAAGPPPGTAADPRIVRVVDGVTGSPVSAAVDPLEGDRVRVVADGYLPRVQPRGEVFLWPARDPDRVREIAFGHAGARLMRWDLGRPFRHCVLGAGVDVDRVRGFAATMTELSGIPGAVSVGVGPLCNVTWEVNEAEVRRLVPHSSSAVTVLSGAGPVIVAARVVFLTAGNVEEIGLHEAGHVLGLSHSSYREDHMNATPRVPGFSDVELVALRLMYRHREPGTTFGEG